MHLSLHVMMIIPQSALVMQTCHLDILDLGVIHSRALSREEFLLLRFQILTMLHLLCLWGRALRLCELFVDAVLFHLLVVNITLMLLLNLDISMSQCTFLTSLISFY